MNKTVPVQHPAVVLRSQYRHLKALLAISIVAVGALSSTVVVLALDDDPPTTAVSSSTSVPSVARPDESKIAASISAAQLRQQDTSRPDESRVAAAIGAGQVSQQDTSRPDESKIAATIGTGSESDPQARTRAYDKAVGSMTPEELARAYGSGSDSKR